MKSVNLNSFVVYSPLEFPSREPNWFQSCSAGKHRKESPLEMSLEPCVCKASSSHMFGVGVFHSLLHSFVSLSWGEDRV